ncbi:MAG: chorismate synthase [Deltaproteobacteria bacterium]|nr:chorismate synthase [Deltaproteobacteria bacterium]MCB9479074.1 chorismate synthase [Deltaproteobacteria bacterium]MCB9488136.1 chorismate synthase [Deltaproteobacteria bacterium]
MASNSFGRFFRITTFGESHGPGLGVVIDGCPAGLTIDMDALRYEMARRRPGQSKVTTPRSEDDDVRIWSGTVDGVTTGHPIMMLIENQGQKSHHYDKLKTVYRPGHADFTWEKKYGLRDVRGGGRSSARETAARVAAGSIARQLLAREGVSIVGHVTQIGTIVAEKFDADEIERNIVRCADADAAARMVEAIDAKRKEGDSLGGIVEVIAEGVPVGWGDPIYEKLDARLAYALMSVNAVKGVEIGAGFASASSTGSANNDPIGPDGFLSNNAGGILGGVSNGMPVVARAAIKPTSSINKTQQTIDADGNPAELEVGGRHDPCVVPRGVPVCEAMVALVLVDCLLAPPAKI